MTTQTFNLEYSFCWVRLVEILEISNHYLGKLSQSSSKFLIESDSMIKKLFSLVFKNSYATFNISQK
jgi:hypothetical protein